MGVSSLGFATGSARDPRSLGTGAWFASHTVLPSLAGCLSPCWEPLALGPLGVPCSSPLPVATFVLAGKPCLTGELSQPVDCAPVGGGGGPGTDWHPQACGAWLWTASSPARPRGALCSTKESNRLPRRGFFVPFTKCKCVLAMGFLPLVVRALIPSPPYMPQYCRALVGSQCPPIEAMRANRVYRWGMEVPFADFV